MIDVSNWSYGYKISRGQLCTTNMLYTPLINPEKNIMCMLWDESHSYQQDNKRLTADLVNFFFERELTHLTLFQGRAWAPKLVEVDLPNRKIFVEWNNESINNIVFTEGRSLDAECPDWKSQIFNILNDIVSEGYYKMALYPHCFFIDQNNQIKTIDFYSCLSAKERYLERSKIEGMIGGESGGRFDEVTDDNGMLDFESFFKNTMKTHMANAWPDNPFVDYYNKLFHD
jgi:hypothetical protein